MTKQEFEDDIIKRFPNFDIQIISNSGKLNKDIYWDYSNKKNKEPLVYALVKEWVSGGTGGGNCWCNGEDHYRRDPEPEPEWTNLDYLLIVFAANITYLQYRQIESKVYNGSYEEDEYYGNSTIYIYKTLKLSDLFELLVEFGYINV